MKGVTQAARASDRREDLILAGTVLRHGKLLKVISDNPASEVKKPTALKVYVWSVEDIARLRASFDGFGKQLLVELDITTGLRSGELRGRGGWLI